MPAHASPVSAKPLGSARCPLTTLPGATHQRKKKAGPAGRRSRWCGGPSSFAVIVATAVATRVAAEALGAELLPQAAEGARALAGRTLHFAQTEMSHADFLRHASLDPFANLHGHALVDCVRNPGLHGVRHHLADLVGNLLANGIGLHAADLVRDLLHAFLLHHRAGGARHALLDGHRDHAANGVRHLFDHAFLDVPGARNRLAHGVGLAHLAGAHLVGLAAAHDVPARAGDGLAGARIKVAVAAIAGARTFIAAFPFDADVPAT